MSLSKIASDTALQFAGESLIGVIADSFFPESSVNDSTVVQTSIEVIAQLMVDGFLTYSYFDWLARRGYTVEGSDPTRGLAFILAFLASQPKLRTKSGNLIQYLQQRFQKTYISTANTGPYTPDYKNQIEEGQVNLDPTASMTYKQGPNVMPSDFVSLTDE